MATDKRIFFNMPDSSGIENDIRKNSRDENGYPLMTACKNRQSSPQSIFDSTALDYSRKKFAMDVNGASHSLSYISLAMQQDHVMQDVIHTALEQIAPLSS